MGRVAAARATQLLCVHVSCTYIFSSAKLLPFLFPLQGQALNLVSAPEFCIMLQALYQEDVDKSVFVFYELAEFTVS